MTTDIPEISIINKRLIRVGPADCLQSVTKPPEWFVEPTGPDCSWMPTRDAWMTVQAYDLELDQRLAIRDFIRDFIGDLIDADLIDWHEPEPEYAQGFFMGRRQDGTWEHAVGNTPWGPEHPSWFDGAKPWRPDTIFHINGYKHPCKVPGGGRALKAEAKAFLADDSLDYHDLGNGIWVHGEKRQGTEDGFPEGLQAAYCLRFGTVVYWNMRGADTTATYILPRPDKHGAIVVDKGYVDWVRAER